MNLILEQNEAVVDKTRILGKPGGPICMVTPSIDPNSDWAFRVKVSDKQAVISFPKFMTLGVGFAEEEDWNTNLPCQSGPEKIWSHISHNKGDDSIPDERCKEAIRMVCEASVAYLEAVKAKP